jgi:hydroxypyruvate isomerase
VDIRFDVNCSILFQELPVLDRPRAAREAGFSGVEFWWPFVDAYPPSHEVESFIHAVTDSGTQLVGLNGFAGNMSAGDRGILSHPGRIAEFRASLDILVRIGTATGCSAFNLLYGNRLNGVSDRDARLVALDNLDFAANRLREIDGVALIEPVSGIDAYPLKSAGDARSIIDAARDRGSNEVGLLFDVYHLVANGEDPSASLREVADYVAHVQIADFPGRGAPGSGTIDFDSIFAELVTIRPDGWVGLEYLATEPASRFEWLHHAAISPPGDQTARNGEASR